MDPNETKIYSAFLIVAGIIGIILIYFVITIIRNQRRHLKLQKAILHVEMTALENERKRIVSDLHDDLGPLLSVVKFQISGIETDNKEDIKLIEKACDNLDDILERIRHTCNQLMPQALIRKGLINALEEFVADLDNWTSMKIEFRHQIKNLPKESEVHLYRMIQEMINNAVKHSGATKMTVNLFSQEDKIIIGVHDNGKGFATDSILQNSKGLGLKNILSRVDILRGDVYLASNPQQGTTYTIEIPNV